MYYFICFKSTSDYYCTNAKETGWVVGGFVPLSPVRSILLHLQRPFELDNGGRGIPFSWWPSAVSFPRLPWRHLNLREPFKVNRQPGLLSKKVQMYEKVRLKKNLTPLSQNAQIFFCVIEEMVWWRDRYRHVLKLCPCSYGPSKVFYQTSPLKNKVKNASLLEQADDRNEVVFTFLFYITERSPSVAKDHNVGRSWSKERERESRVCYCK